MVDGAGDGCCARGGRSGDSVPMLAVELDKGGCCCCCCCSRGLGCVVEAGPEIRGVNDGGGGTALDRRRLEKLVRDLGEVGEAIVVLRPISLVSLSGAEGGGGRFASSWVERVMLGRIEARQRKHSPVP